MFNIYVFIKSKKFKGNCNCGISKFISLKKLNKPTVAKGDMIYWVTFIILLLVYTFIYFLPFFTSTNLIKAVTLLV
jgi:hypothetical protein